MATMSRLHIRGDISITFPVALTGTIEIGASTNTGSGTITNEQFVLSDGTTQTVALGPGPTAYTFNKTGITSITLKQSALGVRLNYIKLNGEKLIDLMSVDTVLDTPMKNYAVLDGGSNETCLQQVAVPHKFVLQLSFLLKNLLGS